MLTKFYYYFVVLLNVVFTFGYCLELNEIIFCVLSQPNLRHEQKAFKLKNEIEKETNFSSSVYLTHIDLKHTGDWTILPILPLLWKKHKQKFLWVFFCTDDTKINIARLKEVLESLSPETTFIGRGLEDNDPTIIHHFASIPNFKYPLFSSGFVVHSSLVEELIATLKKPQETINDFSIDASHELALSVKKNVNNTELFHSPFFCIEYKKNCASYIRNSYICDQPPVQEKRIFFAVKTCHKFHKSRVPVVQKTWGQWTYHLTFYSDVFDKNIPTTDLKVPNTERGHCAKTQAILKEIKEHMYIDGNLEWAVISDDDTIFSTYRIQELLGCYNHTEPIAIGERYGFRVLTDYGYNYITGGGGIVLSRKAVTKISEGNCKCPSDSTPDDMFLLGICLHQLNITIIHIPLFHQARPNDYNSDYLLIGPPISFHKHWMVDPVEIYEKWFQMSNLLSRKRDAHIEL